MTAFEIHTTLTLAQGGDPVDSLEGGGGGGDQSQQQQGQDTGGGGGGGGFFSGSTMMILLLVLVVMWVFLLGGQRKEKKKRAAMLANLQKGRRVQTVGGVLGTVVEVRDTEVVVKVDENSNTRMHFSRSAIQNVLDEPDADKDSKDSKDNKDSKDDKKD